MISSPALEWVVTLVAGGDSLFSEARTLALARKVGAVRSVRRHEDRVADLFVSSWSANDLYAALRTELEGVSADVLIQPVAARRKKILLADMESTVIEQEMLDELADRIGIRDRVAEITRRAMNGELDFQSALRERVGLLRNRPASLLDEVARTITFMPGAKELVSTMKKNGATCWLVSGGFTCFADTVAAALGFDACFSNVLIVRDGVIAGEVAEPILDKDGKRALLDQAAAQLKVASEDILAVGDGANDLPMLEVCNERGGLGVAFRAKEAVRRRIVPRVDVGDLSALLFAQGY